MTTAAAAAEVVKAVETAAAAAGDSAFWTIGAEKAVSYCSSTGKSRCCVGY
jgi:hypothetical protein